MSLTELEESPCQLHVRLAFLDGLVRLAALEPGQAQQTVRRLGSAQRLRARKFRLRGTSEK